MPPAKSRMTIMVDPDVAQFFHEKYNAEVIRKAKAGERIPRMSTFMNALLKEYMRLEKVGELKVHCKSEDLEEM